MLSQNQYSMAMRDLMDSRGVDREAVRRRLMMDESDLRALTNSGHHVGLHSRTHPTRIDEFDSERVAVEYQHNSDVISQATGVVPRTMSHPCGRYSHQSLNALRNIGISVGFIDSPTPTSEYDPLCIPRHDHSDLVRQLLA